MKGSGRSFRAAGSKGRVFYQALERFHAARAAIREKELRSDSWTKLNDDIEGLSGELDRSAPSDGRVRSSRRA